MDNTVLETCDLVKIYSGDDKRTLDDINFSVRTGEIYGLLGPNGAGKTTAISIICSLLDATSGTVRIMGLDAGQNRNKIKKLIGLVPQDIALYSELTVRENLTYFGRQYGLGLARLRLRIRECMDVAGLQEHADKRVKLLSGGLKRRTNLVAGILHEPRLLLLDEPTVGIDAQSRNRIFDMLAALGQGGTTMLYTTHYMEEAERLCSRVAILDKGKIITEDTPAGLISQHDGCGNLEEVFLHLTGKSLRD